MTPVHLIPGRWARVPYGTEVRCSDGYVRRLVPFSADWHRDPAVRVDVIDGDRVTVTVNVKFPEHTMAVISASLLTPVPKDEPCCPKCYGVAGYVATDRVVGTSARGEGTVTGWVEKRGRWDGMEHNERGTPPSRRSKTVQCLDCDRRITRPPQPDNNVQTAAL